MLQIVHRIIFALVAVVALPALAQSDPPARVGRLALIENQVFFGLTVAIREDRQP